MHNNFRFRGDITMTKLERFFLSLMFALLLAGVTLVITQVQYVEAAPASAPTSTPEIVPTSTPASVTITNTVPNCSGCHKGIYDVWQMGLHGQAGTDPVFVESWNSQGQPGACLICHNTDYDPATGISADNSVSCIACHSPVPADHPDEKMPIDVSPDMCGKCHSDPRFATQDWQLSAHYQRNMTCSVCHDPHTAGMKSVEGDQNVQDASDLCANCHKDAMNNFPTSKHAEAGVTCVNCHLGFNIGNQIVDPADFIAAHRAPDHSFVPTLDTCNACHSNQMHAPGQAVAAAAILAEEVGGTPTPQPTPVATAVSPVTGEPAPVSPVGFAGLAALVGLMGGMILSPWLERLYRRLSKGEKKENKK
jgi:predicted CXXCH cytochrome family protein